MCHSLNLSLSTSNNYKSNRILWQSSANALLHALALSVLSAFPSCRRKPVLFGHVIAENAQGVKMGVHYIAFLTWSRNSSVRLQNDVHYIEFLTFQVREFKMVSTISSFWLFKCETSKWCPLYRVFDFSSARIQTGVIHYIIFVTFSHEIHAWDFKQGVLYDLGLQIPNFWNMYVWKVGVTLADRSNRVWKVGSTWFFWGVMRHGIRSVADMLKKREDS
jgi:hypothetical protein